jgi:S1-C subfamily serine protease
MEISVIRDGSQKSFNVHLETFPEEGLSGDSAETPKNAKLGVQVQPLTPDVAQQLGLPEGSHGVTVAGVESGSPAERAGVQQGDVIVAVDGQAINNVAELRSALAKDKSNVRLRIRRGDGYLFLAVPIA